MDGYYSIIYLVGGIPTHLEKYEFVKWDDDIPNMMGKIIHSCSKPPTREKVKMGSDIANRYK